MEPNLSIADESHAIEVARRKREQELAALLLLLIADAADRAEADPTDTGFIRSALAVHAANEIAQSMAEAHLDGYSIHATAADTLQAEAMIADITRQYVPAAKEAAGAMADAVIEVVAKYLATPDRPQDDTLDKALDAAGYGSGNKTAILLGAERNIVSASNGGLIIGALTRPGVTGLRHVSVRDEATTAICEDRDGLQLPIDDPYWLTNWPSLHWRCRSILEPLLGVFKPSDWRPTVPPMLGFGLAPPGVIDALRKYRLAG